MGEVAFLFAGQGAQYTGMGESLLASPAGKRVFDAADRLRPGTSRQCFEGDKETLSVTENTQPCVFAVDLAAAEVLRDLGVTPKAVAGFSLGEVAALTFAGAFSQEAGFSLVCTRGRLMQQAAEARPGRMAAVLKLKNEDVEALCAKLGDLYPVNYNCPGQVAVAGAPEKIALLVAEVKKLGGRAVPLAVGGGFHCPFMEEASRAFLPEIQGAGIEQPELPVYSNRTAAPYEGELAQLLALQMKSPVRWEETVRRMAADGITTFVEVGPGKTLSGFVERILPEARVLRCDTLELCQTAAETIRGGDRVDA